jgi:hypothetical protein
MDAEVGLATVTTRRQLLRAAGLMAAGGALVAACGTSSGTERDRTPDTSSGRQGNDGGDGGDGGGD